MDLLWQQIVIGLVLAGAVAYLVRRAVLRRRKESQCADCHCRKPTAIDGPDSQHP